MYKRQGENVSYFFYFVLPKLSIQTRVIFPYQNFFNFHHLLRFLNVESRIGLPTKLTLQGIYKIASSIAVVLVERELLKFALRSCGLVEEMHCANSSQLETSKRV